jgi:hypothetical protein
MSIIDSSSFGFGNDRFVENHFAKDLPWRTSRETPENNGQSLTILTKYVLSSFSVTRVNDGMDDFFWCMN